MKNFYITTPIYYVNDAPHIGHSYTTVLADILTRFHKLIGYQTFFLTGTDEHGQKVQQAAAKRQVDPQIHVDEYNQRFKKLWEKMNIEYNYFIRTTDADHKEFVAECLQKLWDKGEIYSKEYEGWYSVGEERFFSEEELVDGKDPISGRPVEWLKEKNYFFKMGMYQQKLITHLEENPDWILPDYRRNEILGFLKQPLNDLCISRPKSRLSWGIPLPFDDEYVTYVWFDALINYVSGVRNRAYENGEPIWPASYHLIGKDILTTHCVYWPTMLMALEIPLPKHVLAHGWWLTGGSKMSKSSGTGVNPMDYMEQFGVDAFRYFLAREMVVGQDCTFSDDAFKRRINSDLANDLGNVLNRVHRLVLTNFEGKLPKATQIDAPAQELITLANQVREQVFSGITQVKLSQVIEDIMSLVRGINRYLEIKAPWKLAKDPSAKDELASVLFTAAEAVRLSLCFLWPVMPTKTMEGLAMLGTTCEGEKDLHWGKFQGGESFGEGAPLFPRIEVEKAPPPPAKTKEQNKPVLATDVPSLLDLRCAKIISVEDHPDAESLYVLKVDAGESEVRTICSGLKKSYTPEELKDRLILLFANLKPAPLRGIMSMGMLLAGDGEEGKAVLVDPPANTPIGTRALFKGIIPSESRELKIKDFDKISLYVKDKTIFCNDNRLEFNGTPVSCDVKDEASVH
ncbi:MAG TPA: methionine--tRNA ligase [Fibrobacteraceae bacterium]|jgi:methionyl-tRNA synthetase|nr:methionine--tRNA ligase [Fibrobacteraceae bacterium]HQB64396.1 methionine--tRNA ligase [Fibrobacteraceae bacterium]